MWRSPSAHPRLATGSWTNCCDQERAPSLHDPPARAAARRCAHGPARLGSLWRGPVPVPHKEADAGLGAYPCRSARRITRAISTDALRCIPPGFAVAAPRAVISHAPCVLRPGANSVPAASLGRDLPGATPGFAALRAAPPIPHVARPVAPFGRVAPGRVDPCGKARRPERTAGTGT